MAEIKPFCGIRYSKKAGTLEDLVAPPYDVISDDERLALMKRSPSNVVRLILPSDETGSTTTDAKYPAAAKLLKQFIKDGVLTREDKPAYYIYSQTFTVAGVEHTRTGFMGATRLEKFGEGTIYPHERTLSGPKVDRLKLTAATQTQLSQIFGLYPDPKRKSVDHIASIMASRKPDADFKSQYGRERFWVVTDPAEQKPLTDSIAQSDGIYIADGHHRYETAYGYSIDQRKGKKAAPGSLPTDYVLMMVIPMEDPGLVVLPTHRLVYNIPADKASALLTAAAAHFDIKKSNDADILALTETTDGAVRFGVARAGGERLMFTLKSAASMAKRAPSFSESWRGLDVAVLHLLLLEDIFGIDAGKLERKENVSYYKTTADALAAIEKDKKYQWAFFCRPTRIDQLKAVSDAGEVMPQKSTFFYPKLMAGIVLRPIDG